MKELTSGDRTARIPGGDMTVQQLRGEFASPGNSFRMKTIFLVNDEVEGPPNATCGVGGPHHAELRRQVRSLKEQGFGGLFSYCARFGAGADGKLSLDGAAPHRFLSDWWWQVVDTLAGTCAEEDLEFWVYDEEDWPSGSLGGQLVEQHPEHSWRYLRSQEHAVTGPAAVDVPVGDDMFVAAVAFRQSAGALDVASLHDLSGTPNRVAGGRLRWQAPEGEWTVAVYTAPAGTGLIAGTYGDLMSRQAVAEIIESVYQGHWERVSRLPGASLCGFFSDEPSCSLSMVQAGQFGRFPWYPSMPFTPDLPRAFQQRHGQDWRSHLPLLYHDAPPESLRFRMRHWETCCHLYDEHYFKPIYDFCEQRGVLSSGHLWVEEQMETHLALQGGNLPTHFRHVHVPGIDWICACDSQRHMPSTTPKYAASMAHLMGRPRTWCESFAGTGWGLSFQDMRRIVNWEHVNGINMQIPITYRYSQRRPSQVTFYPPGLTYQQPYWDHLRPFADYEARMCLLTAGLGHVAQVALAYPAVDLWANCWDPNLLNRRGERFNHLGDLLRAGGYDYDILDDQAICEDCRLDAGALRSATERFDVLIVPAADAVSRRTLARCLELVRQGGTAIFYGQLPRHSFEDGSDDPQVEALLRLLLGDDCRADSADGKTFWHALGKGRAAPWRSRVGFAPTAEQTVTMLREAIVPDVQYPPGTKNMAACHRRLDRADLYLVFNNTDQTRTLEVTFSAKGHPELWDAVSGRCRPLDDYEITPAGTTLSLEFHAYEIIALMLHQDRLTAPPRLELTREVPIPGPFDFEAEDTLQRSHVAWNFTQREDGWHFAEQSPPPARLPAGDWSRLGLPWFSGIGHYRTEFDLGDLPADGPPAQVMLDLGKVAVSAEVFVNGRSAGVAFFEPYRLDITSLVRPGRNSLHVAVANTLSNYFAQFSELSGKRLAEGGDLPEHRISGLLGPLRVQVWR